MRLLVTRPQADAERTAAELRRRGHDAVVAPVLTIEPVKGDFNPAPFDAVVITSANAVHALAEASLRNSLVRPVFAVGDRTAQAARDAGFVDVVSAGGDADDLTALIRNHFGNAPKRLLYLAGSERSRELSVELAADGIGVETVVVYTALPAARLPDEGERALGAGRIDGVLHYSRRSAAAFLDCTDAAGLSAGVPALAHYCLSAQVAEPLSARGFKNIRIASRPDEAALLALIAQG